MADLPALGTFNYNGWLFSSRQETQQFACTPVYDSAGRTVVHTKFEITVRDYIAGQPTDSQVVTARRLLSRPGGRLVIRDRGLGDFSVNVGGVRDVAWGPKPQLVSFRYVGSENACEIIWRVEFALPDCNAAVFQFAAAEFNYRVSYDVDQSGLTTRTYSGFVRVPLTRRSVNDRRLPWSADELREKINPRRVEGFRRVPGSFALNETKDRLDFTITDEQMPGPAPPPGVIEAKASHTLTCADGALKRWLGTIDASYEVAVGFPKTLARDHFLVLATDRIRAVQRAVGGVPLVMGFTMREPEIYGVQTAAFNCTFMFTVQRLSTLFEGSGLWRPVPHSDWRKWDATVGDHALGPRGLARVRFNVGEDAIVDLCGVGTAEMRTTAELRGRRVTLPGELQFEKPGPEDSWLDYKAWTEVEVEQGVAELRSLPEKETTAELRSTGRGANFAFPSEILPDDGNLINGYVRPKDQPEVTVEQRAAPLVILYLCGKALRVAHPIPVPSLGKVGDTVPKPANQTGRGQGFSQGVVGTVGGFPLYAAKWRLRYVLEKVPPVGVDKLIPRNELYEGMKS